MDKARSICRARSGLHSIRRAWGTVCVAAFMSITVTPSSAAQHGLVVGINDYAHFGSFPAPPGAYSDLLGAVNDALRIREAMLANGVDLPRERLLIDSDATLENFLAAWNSMLATASPGDTLIVTFAGHGGQEEEVSEPLDELLDGKDETLMFHDFDPSNPRQGRLTDDQLQTLLSEAAQFNVIWVMDSCHSAGLTRTAATDWGTVTRNGGSWVIPVTPLTTEITATGGDDAADMLPNVTQILATASEDRQVKETMIGAQQHGALSWYFAEVLEGRADYDANGITSRAEIADFLTDRVFSAMNQNQQPRVLPLGDAPVLSRTGTATVPKPQLPDNPRVAVQFLGTAPSLRADTIREVEAGARVRFEQTESGWDVFNHTGDRVTSITGEAQRMIARAQALRAVETAKSDSVPSVEIEPLHANGLLKIGTQAGFRFVAPDNAHRFLTLFNIASDGQLQFLYPVQTRDAPVDTSGFEISFNVTPPAGADQLVASFCVTPPLELRDFLKANNGKTAPSEAQFSQVLARGNCQIGKIGLFTSD